MNDDKIELSERDKLMFQAGVVFGMDRACRQLPIKETMFNLIIARVMSGCRDLLCDFPADYITATKKFISDIDVIVASEKKRRQEYYDKHSH